MKTNPIILLMCLTLILAFSIIAYKGYQHDADIKLTLGYAGLAVIHIIGFVFLLKSDK